MSLSALELNNSQWDIELYSRLVLNTGTNIQPLSTSETIIWTISGLDNTTLEPIHDDLTDINYWFTKKYDQSEYVVANIQDVSGTNFHFTLLPQVSSTNTHLGITPIISGGGSVQFSVDGVNATYNLSGIHLYISNMAEEYETWGSVSHQWLASTPPSAVLSGYWVKDQTLSGMSVSGALEYSTGKVHLDLTQIPDNVFEPNYRNLYAKWEGNYGKELDTNLKYISAANLRLFGTEDTKSYYIAVTGLNYDQPYPIATFNYFPRRLDILETNYNFTNATISAVYLQRNAHSCLSINDRFDQTWPQSLLSGRAICWKTASSNLSAYLPLSGNRLFNLANQLSGWSFQIETLQLTANDLTTTHHLVSAVFPEDTLGYRTTAVYDFTYAPIVNEDLKINVLSATLYNEILQVYRQVTTDTTVQYADPQYPLIWTLTSPALSSFVQVCTGIDKDDLSNTSNYICRTNWTTLTGLVGLLSSQELSSSTGIVTGYENVYGSNYVRLNYNSDPDLVYNFSVQYANSPYSDFPLDTHIFQVYSQPANIIISAVAFENEAFTRSLTAKVMNDRGGGVYVPLHSANKIRWNIDDQYLPSVTATNLAGVNYDFNGLTDDTLIFNIQTSVFNLNTSFPTLCTIQIGASAYDTYNTPTTYLAKTSSNVTIDTYPDTSLFNSYLQVNQETSTTVENMWRPWSASYLVTAIDQTTIIGTNVLTGTRSFTLGDGRSLTDSTSSFNYPAPGTYTLNLVRSGVSAAGWLSAHTIESSIDLHLLANFVSANFIAYPTYVFVTSALQVINSLGAPVTSNGVKSYDVNHTEPFILSALAVPDASYVWSIGSETLTEYTSSVIYNRTALTPTSGLPIKLMVYNADFPADMPPTYKSDQDGSIQNYPNVKETDNSSILFEHLQLLNYDVPTVTIPEYTNVLFLPFNTQVSARSEIAYPINVPIKENSSVIYWTLSTPNWTLNSNEILFDKTLSVGNDDTIPGVLGYNATYPLVLILSRQSYSEMSDSFPPYDWGISQQTISTTKLINYQVVPDLLFVPVKQYNLVTEDIIFVNLINTSSPTSSFYINDGYTTTNHYVTAFENFLTSYPEAGTYTLTITGNTNYGIYTNTLLNIVTIVSSYTPFDPDVTRVFGATELTLPISFETTQIPPNEWVTANNLNRSLNLLNNNLTYLKNMTRFYHMPPIAETGWLGLTYTGVTSSFKWSNPSWPNYQDLNVSQTNPIISDVMDIAFRNEKLYIADNIGIKILDNNYIPNILNTITLKTFGDPIGKAKAVSIDSSNRVYVLDQSNNRVLVFGAYIDATNPKSNEYLYEWGGLGSIRSHLLFNNPNDLVVDKNDMVWVADTGNKGLKQYTRTGGWLKTYDLSSRITGTTTTDGGIISFAFDSESNIHILTQNGVQKYDLNGNYLTSYTFLNSKNETPQKICAMDGNGFMYICLPTSVVKVFENGNYAGIFANTVATANYTSVVHNTDKEIFIANQKNILRYIDFNEIVSSSEISIDPYTWSSQEINVKADENVEHWIINRVLQRFWDNIELFRRSLEGEIIYVTDAYGRPQVEIADFSPAQYTAMVLTPKEDIYVGINELVSNMTINRAFKQLYNNLDNLRKYV